MDIRTPDVKKRPGQGAKGALNGGKKKRIARYGVSSKRTSLASRQGYVAEFFLFVSLLKTEGGRSTEHNERLMTTKAVISMSRLGRSALQP